ncbi:hypothetical protein [Kitasatospora sp. NPDC056531]|uniref:hypothetical protein n=1 Tax=Kitasatospora sp. NPDC056531 TaxID=3345856 RepID=UPI00368451C5
MRVASRAPIACDMHRIRKCRRSFPCTSRPYTGPGRTVQIGIALVFLATAFYLGRFGAEDLSEALTYTGRFTGALLLVGSAASLLGLIAVLDHWFWRTVRFSGLVALFGAATALAANLMLFTVTLMDGDWTVYLPIWAALTVGSGWALFTLLRSPGVVILAPKHLAVAAAAGAVVTAANFGYTQLYKPYQSQINPLLDVGFGDPTFTSDGSAVAFPVNMRIENRSSVPLYILGAEYFVWGRDATLTASDRTAADWRSVSEGDFSSRTEVRDYKTVQAGNIWNLPPGSWLEPGQTITTSKIAQLPLPTTYDDLMVAAYVGVVRKDRLTLDQDFSFPKEASWKSHPCLPPGLENKSGDFLKRQARIHENNAIANHIRDPRYITMWWIFDNPYPELALQVVIARNGEECHPITSTESNGLISRYGLMLQRTGWAHKSLWGLRH